MIHSLGRLSRYACAAILLAGGSALVLYPGLGYAQSDAGSVARGGRLYDKWYAVIDADAPEKSHTLYPTDKKYADKPESNWRCKECHGWDGKGKDGAYGKGSHFSGIKGIDGFSGKAPETVIALLKSQEHGFGDKLGDRDLQDLANFVSKGQVDMDKYIDRETKQAKGDASKGKDYYDTLCAQCHGVDGKQIEDMKPMGALAKGNPWENLHKILHGQPAEEMPALGALDHQIAVDVLRYTQDLPEN